ncbi:hypothetical protein [Helicobacter cetorum]|uniref:Outer membrane protein n=1 Tax=Helicobacter cetorum (strain ATCC BAA-429 / MIT 00-7128) TaxID=182217 RepID=I0ELU5_HELC0|nr:hypothetical protein [Helicobacter cetorum]AFI03914.1 hypothetical protein HCW_03165 [Helicobacter cetorum MIT 00-7128]
MKSVFNLKANSRGILSFLMLFGILTECKAHIKDGVFIEGGFESGLLESREEKELKTPQIEPLLFEKLMQNSKKVYYSNNEINDKTSQIFTNESLNTASSGFSTLSGLKVSLDSQNNTLDIKNFMPYALHNLDLVLTKDNGQKVIIGGLESLGAQSQVKLNAENLEILKGIKDPKLSLEASSFSDSNTARVLKALSKINTDIIGRFDVSHVYQHFNPKQMSVEQAKDFTNIMYDLAYVLSSDEWANLVLNYPGNFTNNGKTISKDFLIKQYREATTLFLYVLAPNYEDAGLTANCEIVSSKMPNCNSMGLKDRVFDPKIDPFLKGLNINDQKSRTYFQTLVHEFGHVKGYSHNGNLTCADGSVKGTWCYGSPEHQYGTHDGKRYYKGMVGVTQQAWANLGNADKLPINYKTIGENFTPNESINKAFANSLIQTAQNIGSSLSSSSNVEGKNYHSSMVGVNFKLGYQQYFNDFLGLSYYGIVKYNYSKINSEISKVQQLGLGLGVDLLVDLFNSYAHNDPLNSFGVFVGLRGLYNGYKLLNQTKNTGNLDLASGLNYRYKHSKYSLGVSIPLIQHNIKVSFSNENYQNTIILKEGVSHFNVFFNYGWVF